MSCLQICSVVATSSSYCLLIAVVHRNLFLKSLNDILTISLIPSRLYLETFLISDLFVSLSLSLSCVKGFLKGSVIEREFTTTLHYLVSNLKYQNYSLIEELLYSRNFHGEGGVIGASLSFTENIITCSAAAK